MKIHNLTGRTRGGYTTFGSIWNRGELNQNRFKLISERGENIPVQSKVLAWWPDHSIKWCSHTADSDKMGDNAELLPDMDGKEEPGIAITERDGYYEVATGSLWLKVPKAPKEDAMAMEICLSGRLAADRLYPVFILERREQAIEEGNGAECGRKILYRFEGKINQVILEEKGPLQAVFCFKGAHIRDMECEMPFSIRMYLYCGSEEIRFEHTFLFDGVEERDFLKGMGICMEFKPAGELYNRHVLFATDKMPFHEAAVMMRCNQPRTSDEVLQRQLQGEMLTFADGSVEAMAASDLPVWNHYHLHQDSAYHYSISKRTKKECCELTCAQGKRAPGAMAVIGAVGGVLVGIGDFWQKYPSGLSVDGLGREVCRCTAWFYSPKSESYDFRHYDTRSYPMSCYEGFQEVRASAFGIGVTSRCTFQLTDKFPAAEQMERFAAGIQKPPVYVGRPEYYHRKRAFGYWSLPRFESEQERWLENQMEQAFLFYKKEIEARDWYGLFDYGDIMHTYDSVRHVWKYDTGGFAWQNTELVPTYWLWYYFLRTGREDVYTMAEAMSRHCSEVDIYHFGPYKGMGSRHNVRHWGCSCKEVRIGMAGHHRFLYYLSGDNRLHDVFEDVKDADQAMAQLSMSKRREIYGKEAGATVRSGPDWSSLVSNWMTWYEMTLDESYRRKIENGIRGIAGTPLRLVSSPEFGYDSKDASLSYMGEVEDAPNQHLQICMGGPQVWWETAEMLRAEILNEMLDDLGEVYFMSEEERRIWSGGYIKPRTFGWPMLATGIAAYSAMRRKDHKLAIRAWEELEADMMYRIGGGAFRTVKYGEGATGEELMEIPRISTNFTAQWCLNVMTCLEFIRGELDDFCSTRKGKE